jgi:hypothetical protein
MEDTTLSISAVKLRDEEFGHRRRGARELALDLLARLVLARGLADADEPDRPGTDGA